MGFFNTQNNYVAPPSWGEIQANFKPVESAGVLSRAQLQDDQQKADLQAGLLSGVMDMEIRDRALDSAEKVTQMQIDADEDAARKLAAVSMLTGGLGGGRASGRGLASSAILERALQPTGTQTSRNLAGVNSAVEQMLRFRSLAAGDGGTAGSTGMTAKTLKGMPGYV